MQTYLRDEPMLYEFGNQRTRSIAVMKFRGKLAIHHIVQL